MDYMYETLELDSDSDNDMEIEGDDYHGSQSRAVLEEPIDICSLLRPYVYGNKMGMQWPLKFDPVEDSLSIDENVSSITETKEWPVLYFSKGKCAKSSKSTAKDTADDTTTAGASQSGSQDVHLCTPLVVSRIKKETSQGSVYKTSFKLEHPSYDTAEIPVIVKTDVIGEKDMKLWISPHKTEKIVGSLGSHIVVSEAYMDGMCSLILSNLVESRQTPHFPLCYGSTVANTKLKRSEKSKGSKKQVIWMEWLPHSIFHVLNKSDDYRYWWSAMFQICAALVVARSQYRFVHNDLHGNNIRVRKVPYDTVLYYEDDKKKLYAVPTYGYVYVIIDFGRSFVWLKNREHGFVSSTFHGEHAPCKGLLPDSTSIDLVRLVISIEEETCRVSDSEQRKSLHDLWRYICQSHDKSVDILKELTVEEGPRFDDLLDEIPRKVCKNGDPYSLLPLFYQLYGQTKIPFDIIPFPLAQCTWGN